MLSLTPPLLFIEHSRTFHAVLKSLCTPTIYSVPRINPRVAKEIRLQRRLPKSFDDAVQARRDSGEPRLFTEKELDAVISYVSHHPHFNPYGTPSTFNHEEFTARTAAANSHYRAKREKTLLERVERLSLRDRISVPTASSSSATPIAEKPSTILDFKKLSEKDLAGILKPKLEATTKRLNIVVELLDSLLIICNHRARNLSKISFFAREPERDCSSFTHWFDTSHYVDRYYDKEDDNFHDSPEQLCSY
ncbi:hypothetical protein BDY19DRAFT_1044096 [Irpex rosettiformis]|uniref:Uncharacterized protein n=1 Tax=Irpex rosettiformis TaxID=378272 RepID=A0ACB8UJ92_9APHY|nr:hypothetical protein BDY19DRAFT_1044096 [Irpex rosettiformis]